MRIREHANQEAEAAVTPAKVRDELEEHQPAG